MPGKRIKDLTALSGAGSANDDDVVIFDTNADTTKRISRSQLAEGMVGDLPFLYFHGVLTTDPTQRFNGDSLALGDGYLRSSDMIFRYYTSSGWQNYEQIAIAAATAQADRAEDEADRAEIARDDAQALDSRHRRDVATLLADTTLTYTAAQPGTVVAGDVVRTRVEGFAYEVAASGAADQDAATAGGVKLYWKTTGYGQDQTQYRTGGGAVRQTAAAGGWSFINDAGHEPWGWAAVSPVALTGTDLRVTYDFTAAEVGVFSVTPDESYAAIGLTVGASVGQTISDISGFAPISGRITSGTSGILFSSTSGNVVSQVVDQVAGTIIVTHLTQTHTDAGGSAVMVSPASSSSAGEFAVTTQLKTGFTLQYVRPLSCRITCTTATPGSEVFTVSQTENIGVSAAWVAPGILRVTHPSIGNNFPAPTVNLWRTSAAAYQFKIDVGGTSTDIYFLNADGTSVTVASTNMIIAFTLPGRFPAAIPGGTVYLGSIQRDMVPVDFNQLSGPSSNLWLSFAHPY